MDPPQICHEESAFSRSGGCLGYTDISSSLSKCIQSVLTAPGSGKSVAGGPCKLDHVNVYTSGINLVPGCSFSSAPSPTGHLPFLHMSSALNWRSVEGWVSGCQSTAWRPGGAKEKEPLQALLFWPKLKQKQASAEIFSVPWRQRFPFQGIHSVKLIKCLVGELDSPGCDFLSHIIMCSTQSLAEPPSFLPSFSPFVFLPANNNYHLLSMFTWGSGLGTFIYAFI